jgi:hypothetical protein
MIEFIGPLYNWLQQFTNHHLTGHWHLLTTIVLQLNWLHCTAFLWVSEWVSYITTNCLGVKHPSGAYDQIFYYSQTIAGLLMWGALSEERTLPSSELLWLSLVVSGRTQKKTPSLTITGRFIAPFPSNRRPYIVACSYVAGLFTEHLPRNGSMRHNIKTESKEAGWICELE